MRLTLEADQISQKAWYIDGACAVHEDWKSHSGSFMTFGKGMMNGNSTKQKLNTTSSTHAEVVAVHDNMGAMLWTRYLLEGNVPLCSRTIRVRCCLKTTDGHPVGSIPDTLKYAISLSQIVQNEDMWRFDTVPPTT
jgi:hypothetical protein